MVQTTRYKQTEVGLIPSDWEVKAIGDIFTFYSTSNFSKAEMTLEGEVGCVHYGLIHAIDNTNFSLKNGVKYYIAKEQAKYETLQNGDVVMVDASEDLVGLNKSVEVSGIINKEYIAGLHTFHLRDKNAIYTDSLRCLILNSEAVKKQMLRVAVGMKVFGVSKLQLHQIFVPVPTKAEQTAIATALSDADALISSLEKLIAKKRNIKQGAMQKLLQPKEGWEVKKLGEICENIASGKSKTNSQEGRFPIYGSTGIIGWGNSFDYSGNKILIARVGANAGVVNVVSGNYGVSDNTLMLSLKPEIDLNFIYSFLILFQLNKLVFGSGQPLITGGQLKNILVPLPISKQEQTRIATILSDMDAEISGLETKLEKYKMVKLGMMQNLLTGRIRLV